MNTFKGIFNENIDDIIKILALISGEDFGFSNIGLRRRPESGSSNDAVKPEEMLIRLQSDVTEDVSGQQESMTKLTLKDLISRQTLNRHDQCRSGNCEQIVAEATTTMTEKTSSPEDDGIIYLNNYGIEDSSVLENCTTLECLKKALNKTEETSKTSKQALEEKLPDFEPDDQKLTAIIDSLTQLLDTLKMIKEGTMILEPTPPPDSGLDLPNGLLGFPIDRRNGIRFSQEITHSSTLPPTTSTTLSLLTIY